MRERNDFSENNSGSFFVVKHTVILVAKHHYINALLLEIFQIVELERLPQ